VKGEGGKDEREICGKEGERRVGKEYEGKGGTEGE